MTVMYLFGALFTKKKCRNNYNTYINSGTEETGEFRHTSHDGAPDLAKHFPIISVFLFLPNCIQNWLRLFMKCNRFAIYLYSKINTS
jgi:hypothetical protein